MKNINIFPKLERSRVYQLKWAAALTCVPVFCAAFLTALLFFFAQQNLYFLENSGLMVNDLIRQAYQDQLIIELSDVVGFVFMLFVAAFAVSYLVMGWAVSPFRNAEKMLRSAMKNEDISGRGSDWMSESPHFHKIIWGLANRLKDPNHTFDNFDAPSQRFNFRFFLKFAVSFYILSVATGSVLGIILDTVYIKIVSMAINLVGMNQKGHFFNAQEELLQVGVSMMVIISCCVYVVAGYFVTRYMSNMLFVFGRAVKENRFPLRLRHSDIYHELAKTMCDLADAAGIPKKTQ